MAHKAKGLAAHVAALVAKYSLETRYSTRGRAWHKSKIVAFPPVKSEKTYLLALHEIGHVVYPPAHTGTRLEKEYWAWAWALRHSLVRKLSPSAAYAVFWRLNSYVRWAKRSQNRKVPPRIPPDNHPMWNLLKNLEVVSSRQNV